MVEDFIPLLSEAIDNWRGYSTDARIGGTVADVIKFPRRHRQEQLDFREVCRVLVTESSLAGKYPPAEVDRAVEAVVAVADRYWFKDDQLTLQFSEDVQFTREQMTEINRVVIEAFGHFRKIVFGRAAAERLVLELQNK